MRSKLLLCVLLFLSFTLVAQQNITITGKIRDENKQPLPGATILVKGTSTGAVTDNDGNFTLQVPADAKTLIASYIGYANLEIPVKQGQLSYDINMQATDITMNQVVVSVSKRTEKLLDAPASISVIGADQLEKNIVTTPVDQLKTTPGVDIIRTGLVSSDIVVRGFNNIFSGTVLNVVDDRIGSVPSLAVNAYQLVPSDPADYERIEVVQGPASALYGPNASNGVIHIITKSPLDQQNQFETTVAMTGGFTVLAKSYQQYNSGSPISGNMIIPEIRHSGKLLNGKFGYKISGSYFQGQDYPNYDPREPSTGDSVIFGSAKDGKIWQPDTIGYNVAYDTAKHKYDTTAKYNIQRFNKDFAIRKYNVDARIDIRPIPDLTITINGGLANSHNVELTGLGAAQAGGATGGWTYMYFQTRLKWKKLFFQYYINVSNSGSTYLIPQLTSSNVATYNSTSPPTPYQMQYLVDRSKMQVFQLQHSWSPIEKLQFVYGVDVLITAPNSEGTIYGPFESVDNLIQAGGYIQGEYSPLTWLKLVGAIRVDYNSIIDNVAASPRGAVVFKLGQNQDLRLTYNRAFDSPTTLDQFLDLSNGEIPNGINIRGIGNPYGWDYKFDPTTGGVQYAAAPYGSTAPTTWVTFNNPSYNVTALNNMLNLISSASPTLGAILPGLFQGITGTNGTVAQAKQVAINYVNFNETGNFPGSIVNANSFQNLNKINNQYTQTVELGYKGLLFKKLSVDVNVYWTRVTNYVSPISNASAAVMLQWQTYLGPKYTGILWENLQKLKTGLPSVYNELSAALNNNPAYTNKTIVAPDSTTVWDELVVLMNQLPIGTITPNSPKYIGSDFILTYENLGRLDVFGADLGFQYSVYEDTRNKFNVGGSFSWVDKDQFTLSSGQDQTLNSPKVKAAVTYDHTLKNSGFGYGLTFRYQNGYYGNSGVYAGPVSAAYLLDLRLSYRPKAYKNLLLSINVNDATNYQWASFPGTPLMGAQVFMRAQITF